MSEPTRSHEPHTRLTHLCAEMTKVLDREENADVKAIILLNDAENGGAQIHGYEEGNDTQAVVDMFLHLQAIMRANGKDLEIIAIPDSPQGLEDLA